MSGSVAPLSSNPAAAAGRSATFFCCSRTEALRVAAGMLSGSAASTRSAFSRALSGARPAR